MVATPAETGALLQRDARAPRYTSYPTADRFAGGFGPDAYRLWASRRNAGGADRRLALYVHLPFCRDICFYCGCNKIVTRNRKKTAEYLRYLDREIVFQSTLFADDPRVVQMHWGGGTPTYYDGETLRALFAGVACRFDLDPAGDYSIEVDPRTVDASAVEELRAIGFNRVSFGVQDFDPRVQAAVHRIQSEEQTHAAISAARRASFRSVNVDLIYGLPRQSEKSFAATLARVIEERPDRVALYSYAHLPAVFAPQRRIREDDLPDTAAKTALFALAECRFGAAGYARIGMDHFALPGDALAAAQRQGLLRRDFQGYSAGGEHDVVGMGVTAIGSVGPTYSQNFRTLADYCGALESGELPIMRGIALTSDDLLRRAVIRALMCQFAVSKETIDLGHLVDFDRYFAAELSELEEYRQAGLVEMDEGWIRATRAGRPLIRSICSVFDRYLQRGRDTRRYSRVV